MDSLIESVFTEQGQWMANSMTYYVNEEIGYIRVKAVTRVSTGYRIQYFDSSSQIQVAHCNAVTGQVDQINEIINALPD